MEKKDIRKRGVWQASAMQAVISQVENFHKPVTVRSYSESIGGTVARETLRKEADLDDEEVGRNIHTTLLSVNTYPGG